MNEKEKEEFYIAMCKCCLLAPAMKSCPSCHFNIGLAEKHKPVDSDPSPISVPIAVLAVSEHQFRQ